jgi:hypothetical protein
MPAKPFERLRRDSTDVGAKEPFAELEKKGLANGITDY